MINLQVDLRKSILGFPIHGLRMSLYLNRSFSKYFVTYRSQYFLYKVWCPKDKKTENKKQKTKNKKPKNQGGPWNVGMEKTRPYHPSLPMLLTINEFQVLLNSITCLPSYPISSVQFSSVAQLCPTLCDPMNRSMPGLPVHHPMPQGEGICLSLPPPSIRASYNQHMILKTPILLPCTLALKMD